MAGLVGRLAGLRVCVNGLGITGPPVARLLAARGALVTAVDGRDDEANRRAAKELAGLGVPVTFTGAPGAPARHRPGGHRARLPAGQPAGRRRGRGRHPGDRRRRAGLAAAPGAARRPRQDWLAVTGTNGKTTTVRMLAAMLGAAGYRSMAAGNVGLLGGRGGHRAGAVPGPGGRAVQLPAVLEPVGAAAGGRGAERRRAPPRLARRHRVLRAGQGPRSTRRARWPSATPTTRARASWPRRGAGTARRGGLPARPARARRARRGRRRPAGPGLRRPDAAGASSWPAWPTSGRRARTTWPTRWPRRHWPGPTARRRRRSRPGWPGSGPSRTG